MPRYRHKYKRTTNGRFRKHPIIRLPNQMHPFARVIADLISCSVWWEYHPRTYVLRSLDYFTNLIKVVGGKGNENKQ